MVHFVIIYAKMCTQIEVKYETFSVQRVYYKFELSQRNNEKLIYVTTTPIAYYKKIKIENNKIKKKLFIMNYLRIIYKS